MRKIFVRDGVKRKVDVDLVPDVNADAGRLFVAQRPSVPLTQLLQCLLDSLEVGLRSNNGMPLFHKGGRDEHAVVEIYLLRRNVIGHRVIKRAIDVTALAAKLRSEPQSSKIRISKPALQTFLDKKCLRQRLRITEASQLGFQLVPDIIPGLAKYHLIIIGEANAASEADQGGCPV